MLHEAVAHGHTEAVEALLAAGASVDAKMVGTSTDGVMVTLRPLHVAAGKGDMGPLIALIAAGADLDVTSYNGATPLHLAARQGHASVIEALAAAGASIEAREQRAARSFRPISRRRIQREGGRPQAQRA